MNPFNRLSIFALLLLFVCSTFAAKGAVSVSVGAQEPDALPSPSPAGPVITDPAVLARVGGVDVKVEEMRNIIKNLDPADQAAIASDPATMMRVVRSLLVEGIVLKEVASQKWDQQPNVLARLDKARQTTLADMYLQSVSKPPDDFPSDSELKGAYQANIAMFTVPHQFRIAQIFISIPKGADKATIDKDKDKLNAIAQRLGAKDADFAEIARAYSDEKASAEHGGDMGWISDEKMPPAIHVQAIELAKGAVSNPIPLSDGVHIIKLLDNKDISPIPFDEVKSKIAQKLREERAKANRMAYVNKLLEQSPITLNEKAVSKLIENPKE